MIETYTKGNKSILLINGDRKIILKNPEVTYSDDEVHDNPDDIIYFYYTMSFKYLDDCDNRWKKICKSHVHDFPMVLSLPKMIDNILNIDVKTKGLKEKINEHITIYRYMDCYESILNEDTCRVEKILYNNDKEFYYKLFIGVSYNNENNAIGFEFRHLDKRDLKKIKKWAEQFIKMGMDKENRTIEDSKEVVE